MEQEGVNQDGFKQEQPMGQPNGGQARPPTCYNCGGSDHFLVACPEPVRQVPVGLAAAHAARAIKRGQSPEPPETSQGGYNNKPPLKRQKTGPIVTRFPLPAAGPIVTHYGPPPTQVPPYVAPTSQVYYGLQPMQPYQQQTPLQPQPYPQHVSPQPTMPYGPYGTQAGSIAQGYAQPGMPVGPQGYGQPMPSMSPIYVQSPAQAVPQQFGYPNQQHGPYQNPNYQPMPSQQSYDYVSPNQYGQQQMVGQPPQNYPQSQGQTAFYGQPPQQYPTYQGPSPVQIPYVQQPPPQQQQPLQNWVQPPQNPQGYSGAAYQAGPVQHQKPFQKQFHKVPPRHQSFQHPQFGIPNHSQAGPIPSPGPPIHPKGFILSPKAHQNKYHPGMNRTSGISGGENAGLTAASQAPATQLLAEDKAAEEADFEWDFEHAFIELKQSSADPIAHPLPTLNNEEPILPPAYNATSITSKYVCPNNLDMFVRDIRLSLHWPRLKLDPAFSEIDFDSPLVPLDAVNVWLQQRYGENGTSDVALLDARHEATPSRKDARFHEDGDGDRQQFHPAFYDTLTVKHYQSSESPLALKLSEISRADRAGTPSLDMSAMPGFTRSVTPCFGADDDAWAPQPGEGQIITSPPEDPTEALLASLGVTGSPKPIQPKPLSYHSSAGHKDDSATEVYARPPTRQDSGYVSARGSYSNGSTAGLENIGSYSEYRQSYNGSKPPPPPPPLHMRRQLDGPNDSPESDDSGRGNHEPSAPNDGNSRNTNQISSPLTPTSLEILALEGSVMKERKNNKKPAPLRQEDDVTPKMRRRQPKVADAYRQVKPTINIKIRADGSTAAVGGDFLIP